MSKSVTIVAPWKIPVSKKKDFYPNLNQYRNAHYQVLSKAKRVYAASLTDQLKDIEPLKKVVVTLIAYPPTARSFDNDNLAPHMKFGLDAIVRAGILSDDNYNIVVETRHKVGGIDKENPRVIFLLEEV